MTPLPDATAYAARRPGPLKVSFEFFPPKSAEMEESLWRSVTRLAPPAPRFVSVTNGAGGSPRERTPNTVEIGRASWRERMCQDVSISVVAGSLTKQKKHKPRLTYQK